MWSHGSWVGPYTYHSVKEQSVPYKSTRESKGPDPADFLGTAPEPHKKQATLYIGVTHLKKRWPMFCLHVISKILVLC